MAPVKNELRLSKSSRRPRILVVDDEPVLIDLIDDIVKHHVDCRVLSARSLSEAREILDSGPVELLLVDLHLPDGKGTTLINEMRRNYPSAETIVITGEPTVDSAISALRNGAIDFVAKPFTADQIADRVRKALDRQAIAARNEKRMGKLKSAVRKLNDARKTVSKKVDLLCNDLVSAYGELSRQLDVVRIQESFRKTAEQSRDLEQLLCNGMDWLLRQMGYCNVAVWLASEETDFQLGAYIKYTIPGDKPLTDAMKDGLLRMVVREGFVHLKPGEAKEKLSAAELDHLKDQEIVAVNCTYLGESLASVIMFRDQASAFSDDDISALKNVAPIFAVALAGIVRGTQQQGGAEEGYDTGGYPEEDRPGKKPDPADWWKRGEDSPY